MNPYHYLLSLSGYGYLHDLLQVGDKKVARLKALTHFMPRSAGQEDVWIDCEVTDKNQLKHLNALLKSVRQGHTVLITFMAEYRAFVGAYSGQTPEDPNNTVTLQGKLCELDKCYIDGCLTSVETESLQIAKAA